MWSNQKSYLGVAVYTIMGTVIGFYFSLKTAFRWAPFVAIAEGIFTVFGYTHPARVDMVEQGKKFRKAQGAGAEVTTHAP